MDEVFESSDLFRLCPVASEGFLAVWGASRMERG
jgi:hypothetical protein